MLTDCFFTGKDALAGGDQRHKLVKLSLEVIDLVDFEEEERLCLLRETGSNPFFCEQRYTTAHEQVKYLQNISLNVTELDWRGHCGVCYCEISITVWSFLSG